MAAIGLLMWKGEALEPKNPDKELQATKEWRDDRSQYLIQIENIKMDLIILHNNNMQVTKKHVSQE